MSGFKNIPLQDSSYDTWLQKYCLKDKDGNQIDKSPDDTMLRVAKALAAVEPKNKEKWEQAFYNAMKCGAIPAGRIMANAGAESYKPATSTINCTVSDFIEDSIDSVGAKVHEAILTLKSGAGIGYCFSTLRPEGAFVNGAGASTSGPLSFMDIFDKMCFTISSAGGRRGAQMATFDCQHPDIYKFIKAKKENGRLRQFNLSILITDAFINAVKTDSDWPLVFPITQKEFDALTQEQIGELYWRKWPITKDYVVSEGVVACKVYRTVKARHLWDTIMESTYDYAEPGFILIDEVNKMNNNRAIESIVATNPCGEQPLPSYGACLLGSIDLTKFVRNPFEKNASFDYGAFCDVVRVFTRMLDNVVEVNGLPLEQQRDEIRTKRRHGMGFFGLGSALAMMGIRYGSEAACEIAETITMQMAIAGWETGLALAKEKGCAPIFKEKVLDPNTGKLVSFKLLFTQSDYMKRIWSICPKLENDIKKFGCRFTHHTSIAPTGTMALSFGNNASNGIEPSFSHEYVRNIIKPGKKTKEQVSVKSYELLAFEEWMGRPSSEFELPSTFATSGDVSPKEHVDMQAAVQYWVDSSISKTINVATDIPFEEFKDVYLYAAEKGLKGCTTFRYNPEAFQGVLVNKDDLESREYEFTLEDGSKVKLKGSEKVMYEGEEHVVANLHEALSEGYYGKF